MHRALWRLVISTVIGVVTGAGLSYPFDGLVAVLGGWAAAALAFVAITWLLLAPMNPQQTAAHAGAEDPTHAVSLAIVVVASLASVAGVLVLLQQTHSGASPVAAIVAVASVVGAWALVHTIYSVHYAREFYAVRDESTPVPVTFGSPDDPDFVDFAYLGFTLGMTYQVSDNTINARSIRRDVLKHCLLSYLLGAVVVACTVNLVITLAS